MTTITPGTPVLVTQELFVAFLRAGLLQERGKDGPVGNQWPVWGHEREEDDLIEVIFKYYDPSI